MVGAAGAACVGLALPTSAVGQASGPGGPLRGDTLVADVRVQPDTVTVGAPFRVTVHVRAPRGVTLQFPVGPDSGGSVELLDPRTVTRGTGDSIATDVTEVTASYRLAAWDVGRQSLGLGPLVTHGPAGVRSLPLGDLSVVGASSLPASAGERRPKGARGIFPEHGPWWTRWAIAAAALALLLILALAVRHWRRRRRRPPPPVGAFAVAQRDFADLDRLGLLDAGECGRYVALLAEIVRTYLARRLGHATLSATTSELVGALRGDARVPLDRLQATLSETDLVKFANRSASQAQARALSGEARGLVADVEREVTSAEAAVPLSPAEMRARGLTPPRRVSAA